jgi:hypothetical protein
MCNVTSGSINIFYGGVMIIDDHNYYPRREFTKILLDHTSSSVACNVAFYAPIGRGKSTYLVGVLYHELLAEGLYPIYVNLAGEGSILCIDENHDISSLYKVNDLDDLLIKVADISKHKKVVLLFDEAQKLMLDEVGSFKNRLSEFLKHEPKNIRLIFSISTDHPLSVSFSSYILPYVKQMEFPDLDDQYLQLLVRKLSENEVEISHEQLSSYFQYFNKMPYLMKTFCCYIDMGESFKVALEKVEDIMCAQLAFGFNQKNTNQH